MARLQSGTRIYGTANVDTSVTIGTGVTSVVTNASAVFIGNTSTNLVINSTSIYLNGSAFSSGANVASQYAWTNTHSFSNTITFTGSILANTVNAVSYTTGNTTTGTGGFSANTTSVLVGNSSVFTTINTTAFSGTANNSNNLGGVAAASYVQNTDSRTLSGNLNFSGANLTISGNLTFTNTSDIIVSSNVGIYANGTFGSNGQVLTTNGSAVYWSTASGGGGGGASVSVSATAPSSPSSGNLWWNTETGIMYIYYNDGDSSQWVPASSGVVVNPSAAASGGDFSSFLLMGA